MSILSNQRRKSGRFSEGKKAWLDGQIMAVGILSEHVRQTLTFHCPTAAAELAEVEYAVNRALNALDGALSGTTTEGRSP